MENLIKALTIFLKYGNQDYPTHCEHDELLVVGISEDVVSDEDKEELDKLGFFWDEEYGSWASFHFGSA